MESQLQALPARGTRRRQGDLMLNRCASFLELAVVLCALGGWESLFVVGDLDVLSPRNRELFARLPLPILVRFHGEGSSDPDVSFVVEVDGSAVYRTPASMVIETGLSGIDEGPHELSFIAVWGEEQEVERVSLNISVRTDTDQNDLIYYIPPKDAARPRVFHWLVSSRATEPRVPSDVVKQYPTLFYPEGSIDDGGHSESDTWRQMHEWAQKQNEVYRDPEVFREARFLVARHYPTSGMGNLLQSLVSIFLVSFLTDRILLFDGFLISEFFDFPVLDGGNYSAVFEFFGGTHIALNAQHELYTGVKDWMLCQDLADVLKEQFVFLETDQYFAALLVNNPYYSFRLQQLFGSNLFGAVASFLFRPTPSIALKVANFHKEFLQDRRSVGMHVRSHTLGHPGYVEPYAMTDPKGHFLNSYWKCASFVGGASGVPGDEEAPAILLVTDNGGIRHEAVNQFGGQVVFQEDAIISRQQLDGQRFALMDLLLLSLCNDIITTQMSTFSYVAHGLANKVPYIVTLQGTCVRDISSQPCMHAWRHIAAAAECYNYELPFTSSVETRNCGYYTQQSLTAPKNCEWEH